MVSNNILAFFCRLIWFYFTTVYTEVCMHIKATIVAYAFSVQCVESTTTVTYAGLRVNEPFEPYQCQLLYCNHVIF